MSPTTLAWRPSVDTSTSERRRERSLNPATAASLYLETVLRRCVLDALVVADADGGIVAYASTARSAVEPRSLARVAGAVAYGEADAGIDEVDVYAHRMDVAGRSLVLVSAGSRGDRVRVVASDLSRIFG